MAKSVLFTKMGRSRRTNSLAFKVTRFLLTGSIKGFTARKLIRVTHLMKRKQINWKFEIFGRCQACVHKNGWYFEFNRIKRGQFLLRIFVTVSYKTFWMHAYMTFFFYFYRIYWQSRHSVYNWKSRSQRRKFLWRLDLIWRYFNTVKLVLSDRADDYNN